MRALVTGGAGFIGSHLVDALVAEGHECTVLDDLSRGDEANLAVHGGAVRLVKGSVTDADVVGRLVPDADVVFHLASVVGVRATIARPSEVIRTAVIGTSHVLERALPGTPIVIASSSEVYGVAEDAPFNEASPARLGPPDVHRWAYAHAKACAEHLATAATRDGLIAPTVVRYFNVYGSRMPRHNDPSVVARFLDAALTGRPLTVHGRGEHTRCFVHVDDAVRGTLSAWRQAPGRVVNLGGPVETTVRQLADEILTLTGADQGAVAESYADAFGPAFADPPRRGADGHLARELLGWEPEVGLREGLARTLATWPDERGSSPVAGREG